MKSLTDQQEGLKWTAFVARCEIEKITDESFDKSFIFYETMNDDSVCQEWIEHWIDKNYVELLNKSTQRLNDCYSETRVSYQLKITNYGISMFLMEKYCG